MGQGFLNDELIEMECVIGYEDWGYMGGVSWVEMVEECVVG